MENTAFYPKTAKFQNVMSRTMALHTEKLTLIDKRLNGHYVELFGVGFRLIETLNLNVFCFGDF